MDSYPGFSIPIFVTITIDDEKDHRFYWSNGDTVSWSVAYVPPGILAEEAISMDSLFRQFLDEMPNDTQKTLRFQFRVGGIGEAFPLRREDVIVIASKNVNGRMNYT